ncbi:crooked neck, partial [Mytilus galloprovincialis]
RKHDTEKKLYTLICIFAFFVNCFCQNRGVVNMLTDPLLPPLINSHRSIFILRHLKILHLRPHFIFLIFGPIFKLVNIKIIDYWPSFQSKGSKIKLSLIFTKNEFLGFFDMMNLNMIHNYYIEYCAIGYSKKSSIAHKKFQFKADILSSLDHIHSVAESSLNVVSILAPTVHGSTSAVFSDDMKNLPHPIKRCPVVFKAREYGCCISMSFVLPQCLRAITMTLLSLIMWNGCWKVLLSVTFHEYQNLAKVTAQDPMFDWLIFPGTNFEALEMSEQAWTCLFFVVCLFHDFDPIDNEALNFQFQYSMFITFYIVNRDLTFSKRLRGSHICQVCQNIDYNTIDIEIHIHLEGVSPDGCIKFTPRCYCQCRMIIFNNLGGGLFTIFKIIMLLKNDKLYKGAKHIYRPYDHYQKLSSKGMEWNKAVQTFFCFYKTDISIAKIRSSSVLSVIRLTSVGEFICQTYNGCITDRLMINADNGDEETRKHVDKLMPQKIKKRRKIQTEDGSDAGWEEYHDYIFPDEEASQPNLKLLAMAKKWKQQMEDDGES